MSSAPPPKTSTYRIWIIAVLGALAVLVLSFGALYYRYQAPIIKQGVEQKLLAIVELYNREIIHWRQERVGDARYYQGSRNFLSLAKARLAGPETNEANAFANSLEQTRVTHGYEILLLNADGQTVFSMPTAIDPVSTNEMAGLRGLSPADAPRWIDFHRLDATGTIRLTLISPLRDPDQPAALMGFLLWRMDPADKLYQTLQEWPVPSVSGEMALLRRDGDEMIYLSPLRKDPNAALNRRVSLSERERIGVMAGTGRTGIVEGNNYLRDSVIAAINPVADSPWFLVARINRDEALASLAQLRLATILVVTALILSAASIAAFFWRETKLRHFRLLLESSAKLADSEERLRLALTASGQGIYDVNLETGEIKISREYALMLGYEPDGFQETTATWVQRLHPQDRARTEAMYLDYCSGRRADYDVEFRIRTKSGAWIWVLSTAKIVRRNPDGSPLRLLGTLTNITASKTASEAIAMSEARYRIIFNNSNVAMLLIQADTGAILEANIAATTYYGWPQAELQRMNIADLNTLSPAELHAQIALAREQRRQRFIFRHRLADGRIRDVEVSTGLMDVNGKQCLLSIVYDITDRLQAEAALAEREAVFSTIVNQAVDSIGLVDSTTGLFIEFNASAYKNLGYTREEFSRMGVFDIEAGQDPAEIQRTFVKMAERDGAVIESVHRHKTGRLVEVRVSARPVSVGGRQCFAAIWSDITEVNTNRRLLTTALKEKESLLKEVHHRVKNNLQVIASLLRLESARDVSGSSKVPLQEMQNRIRSMALLHETIYRSGSFAQVDLAIYLRQVATQLFRAQNSRMEQIQLHLELASVLVDLDQAIPCGLIVNELVSNCLKHGFPATHTGEVRVELQRPAPGAPVRLRVADTGVGLPPDFNPAQGKTLGLHLVTDLTRQLRGEFVIEPGPGAGFVIIFLPQTAKPTSSDTIRPSA
jgi:PAS domain S-box-containing protein